MRPTIRSFVLFAAGAPISMALLLADAALWPVGLAWVGLAALLTGLDALMAPRGRDLRLSPDLPGVLYIGGEGRLDLALSLARGRQGASVDLLCDVGELLEPPEMTTLPLSGSETATGHLPLRPLRRGQAEIHRLWMRWRGPLGLAVKQRVIEMGAAVPVLPDIDTVRQAALRFTSRDALHGLKLQHQRGEGSEFNALRDWVPGLDHRSIDWKQSARHRALVCKEFDVERNHHVVLAFDTGHLMSQPLDGIPRLDHAVNASLLLGWACLQSGDRVGLFAFDSQVRQYSAPIGGRQAFARLQRATADLDYRLEETNFTLGLGELFGRLERRSLIIVQSDFVDTVTAELMVENLKRLSARHVVMFVALRDTGLEGIAERRPDGMADVVRAVVADDFDQDRRIVFERLRRLGVLCVEAPSDRLGTDLLNRYLGVKRQELI